MAKRISKSLQRLLRDLDDHLYLLNNAMIRLNAGESAYLKSLAAELRVLVCSSSHTEGLLWRMVDHLKVDDSVHVHFAGNLDPNHPLAKGIDFVFIPVVRAGEGDPRLPSGKYRLRGIFRVGEALLVLGRGYTHEQLIKHVAQQMGSAHEDDGVDPHLAELSEISVGNRVPIIEILKSDAHLALEVGQRTLEEARNSTGYSSVVRPTIPLSYEIPQQVSGQDTDDFEREAVSIPTEGTIVFNANSPVSDWLTDDKEHSFPPLQKGPIRVRVTKHSDATFGIAVEGLRREVVVMRQPIPPGEFPGVHVAIVWRATEVEFYLNGQCVATVR